MKDILFTCDSVVNEEVIDEVDKIVSETEEVTKDGNRGNRRYKDRKAALRKRRIAEENYGFAWYDNLHQYSKNKIHCSCAMCAFNNKHSGWKSYTHADLKAIAKEEFEMRSFRKAV